MASIADDDFPKRASPVKGRSSPIIATIFDKFVMLCAAIPYALVALALRLVIARVYFLSGQVKIDGPTIQIPLLHGDWQFSVTLPSEIKASTFELFQTQYAALPMSPTFAAYLFTYMEFVLPVCLVLGFATRLSALALIGMTLLIQVYVAPEALWSAHVYLFAILAVLVSLGPGSISVDALIRHVYQK